MATQALSAFQSMSKVCVELNEPAHVLRYWERTFPEVTPLKRAGGRRYYRPEDIAILRGIKVMLRYLGYTLQGVQRVFHDSGTAKVIRLGLQHFYDAEAHSATTNVRSKTTLHNQSIQLELPLDSSLPLAQIITNLRMIADELRE